MRLTEERIDFASLCADHPLTELAARAGIAVRRDGRDMKGLCPFHNEKSPSFTIYEAGDRQRFKCFGCGAAGDSVGFIEQLHNVPTGEAVSILRGYTPMPVTTLPKPFSRESDDKKIEGARRKYFTAKPAEGTLVEVYLRGRGINLDRIGGLPASLRFAMEPYWVRVKGTDRFESLGEFPAMLAPIQRADNYVTGVHITYLDGTTGGKLQLPDPENNKKQLPSKKIRGIKSGGCIRLAHGGDRLIIAEGIETSLSVRSLVVGTEMDAPTWTCIDLDNFSAMRLPGYVTSVLFAADNDMRAPRNAKERNTRDTILVAARRLKNMGMSVRVAWALGGSDFNDMQRKPGA